MAGGEFVSIEYTAVSRLVQALGRLPAAVRAELKPAVREAAELVADAARSNASFSDWIPSAIVVETPLGAATAAVVRVDSSQAPPGHEPLPRLEEFGVPFFRHPVFGSDNWVSQEGHPFLFPAVKEKGDEARDLIATAVHTAAVSVGLI